MSEFVIRYVSPHGRQEEGKFRDDTSRVELSMRAVINIDLTPLQECNLLEKLELSHNFIESIDLRPLRNAQHLGVIRFKDNRLDSLDLWPLHQCHDLAEIDLTENRLRTLDVTPIFTCNLLRTDSSVVLTADSILKYILTPEKIMAQFQSVRTDRTAWTTTPIVIWNDYEVLRGKLGWPLILERMKSVLSKIPEISWFNAQKGLLEALNMEELSGLDTDPKEILTDVSAEDGFESSKEQIYDKVVELLAEQVERGGSTLFLDVLKMKDTRASRLIPSIVKQRKNELEDLEVQTLRGTGFLHSLWMTSYGYDILSALDYGLTAKTEELNQIRAVFDEADFDLAIERVSSIDHPNWSNTSRSFRRFVFRLARSHTSG
ncbi:MAG: hypothetical protein ACXADC_10035 [Candidatus Thorarchaeota archaeon]|jgi:hypothetical protein